MVQGLAGILLTLPIPGCITGPELLLGQTLLMLMTLAMPIKAQVTIISHDKKHWQGMGFGPGSGRDTADVGHACMHQRARFIAWADAADDVGHASQSTSDNKQQRQAAVTRTWFWSRVWQRNC